MVHREVLGSVPLLDSKILEAEKALRLVCFWGLEPCPLHSCSRGSCHSHMAPTKPSHADLGKFPRVLSTAPVPQALRVPGLRWLAGHPLLGV